MTMTSVGAIILLTTAMSMTASNEVKEFNRLKSKLIISAISVAESDFEGEDGRVIIYANEDSDSDYFTVEEFTEYNESPSEETKSKIKNIHIPQLTKLRLAINEPIVIRSASRSVSHEIKSGRSGKSQHVYDNGLGAVDISITDYSKKKLDNLEKEVILNTNYTRIARYRTFIHLDYYNNRFGERAYYKNTEFGWVFIGIIKREDEG